MNGRVAVVSLLVWAAMAVGVEDVRLKPSHWKTEGIVSIAEGSPAGW